MFALIQTIMFTSSSSLVHHSVVETLKTQRFFDQDKDSGHTGQLDDRCGPLSLRISLLNVKECVNKQMF